MRVGCKLFRLVKNIEFFTNLKHATFFAKKYFTKNLATLVKKSEEPDIFDGYNPI